MNDVLSRILQAIGPALPTLTALIPIPGAAVIGAIGQQLIGAATATPEQVAAKVSADPAAAVQALQPLEQHLAQTTAAAATVAAQVTATALPAVTQAVTNAVAFVTDDRPFAISKVDADGGVIVSQYLDAKELASLKAAMVS